MQKILLTSLLAATLTAHAADTHGYLAFWHNPDDPKSVPYTLTTQEDSNRKTARIQLNQFCRDKNAVLNEQQDGCFGITHLHNQCAAAAWSNQAGLLRPDNLYIARAYTPQNAQQSALKKCEQTHGKTGVCEVETIFCSSADAYHTE